MQHARPHDAEPTRIATLGFSADDNEGDRATPRYGADLLGGVTHSTWSTIPSSVAGSMRRRRAISLGDDTRRPDQDAVERHPQGPRYDAPNRDCRNGRVGSMEGYEHMPRLLGLERQWFNRVRCKTVCHEITSHAPNVPPRHGTAYVRPGSALMAESLAFVARIDKGSSPVRATSIPSGSTWIVNARPLHRTGS